MSAPAGVGYAHRLYLPADTVVHRLPAEVKLVTAVLFLTTVVATPRERLWAFALHAALLAVVVAEATIPLPVLLRRMTVELPFVAFALLMPVLSGGPRVRVLGVALSLDGLSSCWNVLVKACCGMVVSIVLASTTQVDEVLAGLQRLRLPPLVVQIASFMVRYVDVVVGEAHRMRVALESRGFTPRDPRHWPTVARSVATGFVRVYERGERVHLAMLARGSTGRLPCLDERAVSTRQWATALSLPLASTVVVAVSLLS